MQIKTKFTITEEFNKNRLDVILSTKYPEYSRTYFKKLIQNSKVLINGAFTDSGKKLKIGDEISIEFDEIAKLTKIEPENIALDIIYEDEDIIVINKPCGMVVHPACGNYTGTLVNALVYHCKKTQLPINNEKGWIRPGIVHRLDKDTSGILLVAKTEKALFELTKQFQNRKIQKTYFALCYAKEPHKKGKINIAISRDKTDRKKMSVAYDTDTDAKPSITNFEVIKNLTDEIVLVKAMPLTGRTHQIRVHLTHIGLPILGDPLYGKIPKKIQTQRLMLHAYKIEFTHPTTNKKMSFIAELPEEFET